MAVIEPGTPAASDFQDAIQRELAVRGYSTDDDTVMAEYCVVMLGNQKTKESISSELAELVGSDFDNGFVDWLFDEMDRHFPDPNRKQASPSSAAAQQQQQQQQQKKGGKQIFGQAVTGVKRGAQDDSQQQPPQQRQRQDYPTGPRNDRQQQQQGDRRRSGRGNNDERSIFDRVTPRGGPGSGGPRNNNNQQQNGFDPIAATIEAVNRGQQPPGVLASIPFPVLMSHPASKFLNPQALAQAQAAAMAQAQAFAAMSGAFRPPPGGGPPQFGGGPPMMMMPGGGGPMRPGGPGGGGGGRRGPLPSKPQSEQLCKAGVECKKAECRFSHPSPVATKESGLVLSSEPCEKQLDCADADCPKSHVSPAQKNIPPEQRQQQPQSQPAPSLAANVDPSTIAGAGAKPCKFGANCTRPGCVFVHPWDLGQQQQQPCRYGENCARPDCRFAHPPARRSASGSMPRYDRSKFSATFNNNTTASSSTSAESAATSAPAPATITSTPAAAAAAGAAAGGDVSGEVGGGKPDESDAQTSDRLKRFGGATPNKATKANGQEDEKSNGVTIDIEPTSPVAAAATAMKE